MVVVFQISLGIYTEHFIAFHKMLFPAWHIPVIGRDKVSLPTQCGAWPWWQTCCQGGWRCSSWWGRWRWGSLWEGWSEDETLRRGGVRKHEKKKDEHEIRRAGKTWEKIMMPMKPPTRREVVCPKNQTNRGAQIGWNITRKNLGPISYRTPEEAEYETSNQEGEDNQATRDNLTDKHICKKGKLIFFSQIHW